MTQPQDSAAMPPASTGSVDEYKWAGGPLFSERFKMAHAAWEWCADNAAPVGAPVNIVTVLFSLGLVVKAPALTDAEREAIEWASKTLCVGWHDLAPCDKERTRATAVTLRGLLERLGGGE